MRRRADWPLMLAGALIMLVAFFLVYNLGKKEIANIAAALGKEVEEMDTATIINATQQDD